MSAPFVRSLLVSLLVACGSTDPMTSADEAAPTVTLTGLTDGQTVMPGASLTLSATATDDVGVTRVDFHVDSTVACSQASEPYTCTWTVPATAGATYALSANAYDAAGNVGSSSTVTVTATASGGSGLTHGKDLTVAMVGPAAIGITSFTASGNSVGIYDASSAPYLQQIPASATYDGVTVTGPHLLMQGVSISGSIDVYAAMPVVIRGCKIRGSGYWSVYPRPGAGPVYILYSDLGGTAIGAASDEVITTSNDGHNVFLRNYISLGGDGFSMGSQNDQVLENYVEMFDPSGGAHNDGLQAAGDNNGLLIARNKILLNTGETGAINLGAWGGALAQYVTIDANYFAGGGWTFYGGGGQATPSHDISVTNNVFGFDFHSTVGAYGPGPAYWDTGHNNVWSNNVEADGTPVVP